MHVVVVVREPHDDLARPFEPEVQAGEHVLRAGGDVLRFDDPGASPLRAGDRLVCLCSVSG